MPEQHLESVDCVVIGAGVSGLVAATRMARDERSVIVLEASARVGGCIHSWRLRDTLGTGQPGADFWLELGAHTAYNSYSQLLEALQQRGRLSDLLLREKLGYSFVDAVGGLQSPLKRLNFFQAAISLPFGIGKPKPGRSVEEWFSGLLGRGNYKRLLAPAFAAVLSQPADAFPAEWLFRRKPRMQAAPRKYTFPEGLQGLLEALVDGADFGVHFNSPVEWISHSGAGFQVQAAGRTITCRQLILAVPVDVAAILLKPIYDAISRELQTFPISSSEAVGVVLPVGKASMKPVAGLIPVDDDFFSVVTRDPVPHATLRGFTFHFKPGRLALEEKLARIAAVLGVTPGDFLHVREATNMLPLPSVEHPQRVVAIDAQLAREPLALVGNYMNGLAIGDCAERAAQETDRLLAL